MGEGNENLGQSGAPGVYSRFQLAMAAVWNARTGPMVSGLGAGVALERKSGEIRDSCRRH